MHGTDPVHVQLLSHCLQPSREVKLSLDLFAIVIVHKIGVQGLKVIVLEHGQVLSLELSQKVAEIHSSVESDPVILSVKNEPRGDEVLCENLVWNSLVFMSLEFEA